MLLGHVLEHARLAQPEEEYEDLTPQLVRRLIRGVSGGLGLGVGHLLTQPTPTTRRQSLTRVDLDAAHGRIVERERVHRSVQVVDPDHRIRPAARGDRQAFQLGDSRSHGSQARDSTGGPAGRARRGHLPPARRVRTGPPPAGSDSTSSIAISSWFFLSGASPPHAGSACGTESVRVQATALAPEAHIRCTEGSGHRGYRRGCALEPERGARSRERRERMQRGGMGLKRVPIVRGTTPGIRVRSAPNIPSPAWVPLLKPWQPRSCRRRSSNPVLQPAPPERPSPKARLPGRGAWQAGTVASGCGPEA